MYIYPDIAVFIMVKFNRAFGAVIIFGGILLLILSFNAYLFQGVLCCVPGWVHDYWLATAGLLLASGLGAILTGRCLMDDDSSYMALGALLSIVSIIPIYGIQLSLNEAASNIDIAGGFLLAIISITVLFQIYPFCKGMPDTRGNKQWIILTFIALMLIVIGIAAWPISFDCFIDSEIVSNREMIFTHRYAAVANFLISGIILFYYCKNRKSLREKPMSKSIYTP